MTSDAPTSPAAASRVPSPGDGLLVCHAATKQFGGLTAVTDFNLSLTSGDLFGLIGPNGAGKTTAFNLITGVYTPTSGGICLGGRHIEGRDAVSINRAGIARTFQNIRLFKNLPVLANVTVALRQAFGNGFWPTLLRTAGFKIGSASGT